MSKSNEFTKLNKEMGTFETLALAVKEYPVPKENLTDPEADGLCIGEKAYYKRSGFEAPSKYSREWLDEARARSIARGIF